MIKVLELFSGYGSQSLALEYLGIEHKSDISEIDQYAIKAYNQIHGDTHNWGDITKIDETKLPYYDLITYSSPCQDFSVAGLGKGGDEGSGTRSSLLWECERIIRAVKPKYLLMENVKNLVGKAHKHNFIRWLRTLEMMGYQNFYQVLNAKDYGIPQNRERVFVVSILGGGQYLFPNKIKLEKRLKDILEPAVDEKYYLSDNQIQYFINSTFTQNRCRLQDKNVCDTLMARDYKDGKLVAEPLYIKENTSKGYTEAYNGDSVTLDQPNSETRRGRVGRQISNTLTTACNIGVVQGGGLEPNIINNYRIRKLTPRECWRLMGVKDEQYDKLHDISNTQLYKMAGNSIVVDVLMGIFKNLFQSDDGTNGQLQLF